MSNLRTTISRLANDFAQEVLDAIRRASLDDILDETGRGGSRRAFAAAALDEAGLRRRGPGRPPGRGRGGRLRRRSADDLAKLADEIVDLLEKHPEGLRAEQIRDALNVQAKELPRPLADALSARKISKKGQKRATTYFSRGNASAGGGGGKKAAKGGARAAKKGGGRGKKNKAAASSTANGATATA
jgi:hypothetical protein